MTKEREISHEHVALRTQGELKGLGISVSATTIATALRSAGVGPGAAADRPQLV
jgi:hypothetical protein